jgi:hypothetical protein
MNLSCSPSARNVGLGVLVRYRRTARLRSSSGYFFGAAIETPFIATRP